MYSKWRSLILKSEKTVELYKNTNITLSRMLAISDNLEEIISCN
jgi:hypothetical protein